VGLLRELTEFDYRCLGVNFFVLYVVMGGNVIIGKKVR